MKYNEKRKSKIPKDKNDQNPPKKFESLKKKDKINENVKSTEDVKLVNNADIKNKKKRKSTRRGSKKRATNLDHIGTEDESNNILANKNKNKNIKKNNLVINSKILNTDKGEEKKDPKT